MVDWEKDTYLELPLHEVHATSPDGGLKIEILLNEVIDGTWVFRRNPVVMYPAEKLIRNTEQHIPILSPEIVLLYKAKIDKPEDEADILNTLTKLGLPEREWLKKAIQSSHGRHRWLALLENG
jgi:hypothetical protein